MNGVSAARGVGEQREQSRCPGGRKDNRLWVRSGQGLACLPAGSSPAVPLLNSVRKSWNTRAAPSSGTAGRGAGEPGVQVQM